VIDLKAVVAILIAAKGVTAFLAKTQTFGPVRMLHKAEFLAILNDSKLDWIHSSQPMY
jgi:hypothetical protein